MLLFSEVAHGPLVPILLYRSYVPNYFFQGEILEYRNPPVPQRHLGGVEHLGI